MKMIQIMKRPSIVVIAIVLLSGMLLMSTGCTAMYGYYRGRLADESRSTIHEVPLGAVHQIKTGKLVVVTLKDQTVLQGDFGGVVGTDSLAVRTPHAPKKDKGDTVAFDQINHVMVMEPQGDGAAAGFWAGATLDVLMVLLYYTLVTLPPLGNIYGS